MGKYTIEDIRRQNITHTRDVMYNMGRSIHDISKRMYKHDYSKFTPGAEEMLTEALNTKNFDKWEDFHFGVEDHHREFYLKNNHVQTIKDTNAAMSLEAIMELVADGASAAYRRKDKLQTWTMQFDFYRDHGWGVQMATILATQFMKYYNALIERDYHGK